MNKQAEGCINVQTKVFSKDAVLVLVASFFYMSCPMIVTPIITGFTGMLGGTGFVMGVIGGLVNLVSLGCRPVAGNLADKMDEYHLALAGSGLMLIGCIGYCVAPSILVLVLARVINGIGYACCSVSMSTWLSILLPKDKIGSGMGLYGTVQALGMAVAPAFGIKIQSMFGYRAVFVVAVLFALVTILVTLLIRNHGIEDHSGEEPSRKGLQIIDGKVVPIALIVMLFTIPYLATQSFLISYVEKKGIAVDTALFFPLYAVVLVALRSGFRNYFDKVPYRRFLFISMVSSVLALLSLQLYDIRPADDRGSGLYGRGLRDHVLGFSGGGHPAGRTGAARHCKQHILCRHRPWCGAGGDHRRYSVWIGGYQPVLCCFAAVSGAVLCHLSGVPEGTARGLIAAAVR